MARSITGEILSDGNGEIKEWQSEFAQSTSYATSTDAITKLDIEDFIATKPSFVNVTRDSTAYLYDNKTSQRAVSNIDYILLSASINYSGDVEKLSSWLENYGLHFPPIDDINYVVRLPFEKYFAWIRGNASGLTSIYFSSPASYNSDYATINSDKYYSLATPVEVGGTSPKEFSWIRDNNYFGYFSVDSDHSRFYMVVFDDTKIRNILGTFTLAENPTPDETNGIPSLPFGGAGDIVKRRFDTMTEPNTPTLGISTSGMYNVYEVGEKDLSNFASQLFHSTEPIPYEGDDVLEKINNTIEKMYYGIRDIVRGNLKDYVIDCHIIPVYPTTEQNRKQIQIGGYLVNQLGRPVTSDYVTINCGTIKVDASYDGFEDYETQYKLYLPFIGFIDVDPNYIANAYLTIKYRFNIIDGSCIAFVSSSIVPNSSDTSIVGVYSGSCCVHMPLTGSDYSTIISGMLQTAGSVATAVATKNPLTALGGTVGLMNATNSQKYSQSNNYNASTNFMGIRKPYLLVQRPTRNLAANFWNRKGGLVNSQFVLTNLKGSGYTVCENVDMTNFRNLDKDIQDKIKELLESGVYL